MKHNRLHRATGGRGAVLRRLGCAAALLVPVLANAAPITGTSQGVLTNLLNAFLGPFQSGFANLMPWAQWIWYTLAAIELVWAALYWALEGENFLPQLISKILFIGVFFWLITNWSTVAHDIITGFVDVGAKAGGAADGTAVADLRDPSQIVSDFWNLAQPVATYQASIPWYSLGKSMMFGFAYLILIASVFIIAIQAALTYLEFYLIAVLATVLIPFGINRHTAFLSERAFGAVIANGVKTAVLAFILAVAHTVITEITPPGAAPSYADVFNLDAAVVLIAFLAWHAPGLAASLMGGGPALHAGHIARMGGTAGYLLGRSLARGDPEKTSIQQVRKAAGAIGRGSAITAGRISGAVQAGAAVAAVGGSGQAGQALGSARAVGRMAALGTWNTATFKGARSQATAALKAAYERGQAGGVQSVLRPSQAPPAGTP